MNEEKGNIGEEFVNEVAFGTFLKYWCYPGPRDEKGDKKEICDLLILFDNTAIIISVKNYEFKGNYQRYFRNTTDKALSQIHGAERKLYGSQNVYIKHPDKPIELFAKEEYTKVYRIIVNLGEGLKFYNPSHYTKAGNHVTIMERSSWEGILQEMDTISDVTRYLDAREELFSNRPVIMLPGDELDFDNDTGTQFMEYAMNLSNNKKGQVIISGTENDLLAEYILNQNDYPIEFKKSEIQGLMLQIDGKWNHFIERPEVKNKKEKDKPSYLIDDLVKRDVLNNSQGEIIARKLMSLSRMERRMVSTSFITFFSEYENKHKKRFFARAYHEIGDRAFIFYYHSKDIDSEKVKTLCNLAMDSFAVYTKYKVKDIILIGATDKMGYLRCGYSNYDVPFSQEEEKEIMDDSKLLGWFKTLKIGQVTDFEY